ncbi:MAG: type II secretion system F family protein [Candidatus Korobacteraceae bacterium]
MLMILTFLIVLVLTASAILVLTRPTAADRAIEGRVAGIQASAVQEVYLGDGIPEFLRRTKLSEIDWLDNLLKRWNVAHKIELLITQAESSWTVPMVLGGSVASAAFGFTVSYVWLPDMAVCVVLGILFSSLPFFVLQVKRARRMRRFNQGLPDAIDLVCRALRAGHSLSAAIEIVGQEAVEPVRTEFREVYRQQNFGLPQRDALLQLARRVPSADLQFVVTAMLVQKETGGNLVDILERTVAVIRDRMRIEGEVRIYTAQGRLTGVILALLPIIMFFLINISNHGYARILVEDPMGRKLIYTGLTFMILGGIIIRKIVNVKV